MQKLQEIEELLQQYGVDELDPLVNEELKSQLSVKTAVCDYEGCAPDDIWPLAM